MLTAASSSITTGAWSSYVEEEEGGEPELVDTANEQWDQCMLSVIRRVPSSRRTTPSSTEVSHDRTARTLELSDLPSRR